MYVSFIISGLLPIAGVVKLFVFSSDGNGSWLFTDARTVQ